MSTTAIPLSRPQLPAWCRSTARLPDFVALMKPRVMALAVFTAIVGLAIASGHLDPLLAAIAIIGIAVGAGAAGALNMWYDADIDAVMARTARRPIPRGRISRAEALVFGLALPAVPLRLSRSQSYPSGSAARLRDLLLHRRLYGVIEAKHAPRTS
jgi:protoheme IX farnesyltransferase